MDGNSFFDSSVADCSNITQYNVPGEVLTKLDANNPSDARSENQVEIAVDYAQR